MKNIPSNFSPEEIIKHVDLPPQLVSICEKFADEIAALERENASLERTIESLDDQLYHCKEFIESTKIRCESATKCKDLTKAILTELENSYIEL